ncbi:hypothetical protein D3C72_2057390 [compost metagenome]
MGKRQAARGNEQAAHVLGLALALEKGMQTFVIADERRHQTVLLQGLFKGIVTDAQAGDLRHAFHAPDDAEETIGFANRQVARMQFGKVGPSGQVLPR